MDHNKLMKTGIILCLLFCFGSSIQVLFWNLRTFGIHRASNSNGLELSSISNYSDLIFFAEVKDAECDTSRPITCPLRTFFQTHFPNHQVILSPPLHYCDGHHSGSENYGILIRNGIEFEQVHYPDPECLFIRRPYGIRIKENTYLTFHSNPGNERELVSLEKVFGYFQNQNTLLIGDLNTGCHYVQFETLRKNPIGSNYDWILPENAFTNLEKSCPYDRIITTKDLSNQVYDSRVLNHNREAERIKSDHYPIALSVN